MPSEAMVASNVKFDWRFEIGNLNYLGIDVHISSNSFLGGLQTASIVAEVNFDLRFEISNLIYPGIHVYVAYNSHISGLWGCGGLQMNSEAAYVLLFEISDLLYRCRHVFMASKGYCELILKRKRRPMRTCRPACFAAGRAFGVALRKSRLFRIEDWGRTPPLDCGVQAEVEC